MRLLWSGTGAGAQGRVGAVGTGSWQSTAGGCGFGPIPLHRRGRRAQCTLSGLRTRGQGLQRAPTLQTQGKKNRAGVGTPENEH